MRIIYALLLCLCLASSSFAKESLIYAEGAALCGADVGAARHAALADALRRAVEQAFGVFIDAETATKNYALMADTVHTTADGYVEDYRIVDERRDGSFYRVKIEAKVVPGSPENALRAICKRAGNPKFRVISTDSEAARLITNALSRIGAKVLADGKPDFTIDGTVDVEPMGEVITGSGVYQSSASAGFTITRSGVHVAAVDVVLKRPLAAVSQAQADRDARERAVSIWIERNIPLMLIGTPPPFSPPAETLLPTAPAANDVLTTGERVVLEPGAADALAAKLASVVSGGKAFATTPVDVALSRFRLIGVGDTALAEDFREDLSSALVKTGVFQLVERGQLDRVLSELRIENSGLADSETARKLGGIVGARAVLVGSISERNNTFVINARLINTETGRVDIAESISVERDRGREPVILKAGGGR